MGTVRHVHRAQLGLMNSFAALFPALQTLISGAVVEQLDFLRISDTEE